MVEENCRLGRAVGVLKGAVLHSQIDRRAAFTVNLDTITVGVEFAVVEKNILTAVTDLRNGLRKGAAGEYELIRNGLLQLGIKVTVFKGDGSAAGADAFDFARVNGDAVESEIGAILIVQRSLGTGGGFF